MLDKDAIDALKDLGEHIAASRPDAVKSFHISTDELVVMAERDHIVGLLRFLREDPQCDFETMIDICGVDYPERAERFEVVYHLLSMHLNHRVRVRVSTDEDTAVPSACAVWPAANWFEREVFDMFGILFSGHPDLRRILTDYGFRGYPLRKDFPTTGYTEVRYDEVEKRVVYEPVSLVQEYRQFDFMSPWEGAEYILPGDEKKAEGK
mgnify:FL=1